MTDAGALVAAITAPVGGLVDDLGGRKVVHGQLSARDEVLVLIHHEHPDIVPVADILAATKRRDASTIRKALRKLWRDKLIEGDNQSGYRLTSAGYAEASALIASQIS